MPPDMETQARELSRTSSVQGQPQTSRVAELNEKPWSQRVLRRCKLVHTRAGQAQADSSLLKRDAQGSEELTPPTGE